MLRWKCQPKSQGWQLWCTLLLWHESWIEGQRTLQTWHSYWEWEMVVSLSCRRGQMPSYNCTKVELLPPHNYTVFKEICPHWEFTISPQAGKSFSCLQCYTGQQESTKQMLSIYSIPCTEGRYEQNLSRYSAHTQLVFRCAGPVPWEKGRLPSALHILTIRKKLGYWDFAQSWEMEKSLCSLCNQKNIVCFLRLLGGCKNQTNLIMWQVLAYDI